MLKKPQLQFLLLLSLVIFSSCKEEKVPEPFYPKNDHEAYEKALENANLLNTALGQEWLNSAEKALNSPEAIELPYEEAFYVDNKSALAMGYQFDAKRGQKIQISISEIAADSMKRFVDLFRIEENNIVHIASADSTGQLLGFEPRKDARYVLRFQSELLRGGSFKITFENVPSLAFPVAGRTHHSIGSIWGDERDGGRRSHEGVDIFAPRGTPVVAPTEGIVKEADERGIGGKVVWLADSKRSQTLYFAHLNDWNVKKGDHVKVGDTLGFVGNTGNARTTPPHLHFGIYSRGAMNPIHHLKPSGRQLKQVESDLDWLGLEMRMKSRTKLYADLKFKKELEVIEKDQIAQVMAIDTDNCRVILPNGQIGYIKKRSLTKDLSPIIRLVADFDMALLFKPDLNSFIGHITKNESLDVIGKSLDYLLVKTSSGKMGWIKQIARSDRSESEDE